MLHGVSVVISCGYMLLLQAAAAELGYCCKLLLHAVLAANCWSCKLLLLQAAVASRGHCCKQLLHAAVAARNLGCMLLFLHAVLLHTIVDAGS